MMDLALQNPALLRQASYGSLRIGLYPAAKRAFGVPPVRCPATPPPSPTPPSALCKKALNYDMVTNTRSKQHTK